ETTQKKGIGHQPSRRCLPNTSRQDRTDRKQEASLVPRAVRPSEGQDRSVPDETRGSSSFCCVSGLQQSFLNPHRRTVCHCTDTCPCAKVSEWSRCGHLER